MKGPDYLVNGKRKRAKKTATRFGPPVLTRGQEREIHAPNTKKKTIQLTPHMQVGANY